MKKTIALLCLLSGLTMPTYGQFFADLETGLVLGTPYNTIRRPTTGGTTFDIGKDLKPDAKPFYRIRLGYTIADRHTISVLYAPLTVTYKGAFSQPVQFNGEFFLASQPIEAKYRFNSYRLTYRYDFIRTDKLRLGLGLTAKIRDADIKISGDQRTTNFSNVGFVPLLNFYAGYQLADQWRAVLEGDALGSKQGRAEDIFLGATYTINPTVSLKAGYRVVEGGANVTDIYNFTWINYASIGARITL